MSNRIMTKKTAEPSYCQIRNIVEIRAASLLSSMKSDIKLKPETVYQSQESSNNRSKSGKYDVFTIKLTR